MVWCYLSHMCYCLLWFMCFLCAVVVGHRVPLVALWRGLFSKVAVLLLFPRDVVLQLLACDVLAFSSLPVVRLFLLPALSNSCNLTGLYKAVAGLTAERGQCAAPLAQIKCRTHGQSSQASSTQTVSRKSVQSVPERRERDTWLLYSLLCMTFESCASKLLSKMCWYWSVRRSPLHPCCLVVCFLCKVRLLLQPALCAVSCLLLHSSYQPLTFKVCYLLRLGQDLRVAAVNVCC